MSNELIIYKLYLQTLNNIINGDEVKGDRETLAILYDKLIMLGYKEESFIRSRKNG